MPEFISSLSPIFLIGISIGVSLLCTVIMIVLGKYIARSHRDALVIASMTERLNNTKSELLQLNQKYVGSGIIDTLNVFLTSIRQPAVAIDDKGAVIMLNPAALAMSGYALADILMRPLSVLFRTESEVHNLSFDVCKEVLTRNYPEKISSEVQCQNGSIVPVTGYIYPYEIEGMKRLIYLFGDATGDLQKETEQNSQVAALSASVTMLNQRLSLNAVAGDVFNQSPIATCVISTNGTILLANPYLEKLLEVEQNALIGKPYNDVLQLTDKKGNPAYVAIEQALVSKLMPFTRWTFLTTRKGKIPIIGFATPATTQNHGVIISFIDANDLYSEEAEDKAFFSGAAHDLRTPLTAIRGFIELITDSLETMPKDQIRDMLTQANAAVLHLVTLVNDLLQVSRIDMDRVQLTKESFNIITLTDEVIKSQDNQLVTKKLYIHHELTDISIPKVIADKTKTHEVLLNLLSNAIKYTQQGGITVTHEVQESKVITTIRDTGIGISPNNQGLLFKKFQQIGTSRYQPIAKSTGLGLYIAKKFAQIMGGDLNLIQSEPEKGSTFQFTLPIAPLES